MSQMVELLGSLPLPDLGSYESRLKGVRFLKHVSIFPGIRSFKNRELLLPRGIGAAVMDGDMTDAINRLLRCLQSDAESQILGPGLVREILYRALCGTQAPGLYSLAMHGGTFSQVAHALKIMQSDYAEKLDVEQLADLALMSTSAFHRAFKEITSDSPMQYLKKLRLTKARDLMVQESM